MKKFVYFMATEGGMDTVRILGESLSKDLEFINAWLQYPEDHDLLAWAQKAEVGEMRHHRMGYLVRLKDI